MRVMMGKDGYEKKVEELEGCVPKSMLKSSHRDSRASHSILIMSTLSPSIVWYLIADPRVP